MDHPESSSDLDLAPSGSMQKNHEKVSPSIAFLWTQSVLYSTELVLSEDFFVPKCSVFFKIQTKID